MKMTAEAIEANIPSRWQGKVTTTGKVTGVYADGIRLIRVRLDGRKTDTRYWTGFWEPAPRLKRRSLSVRAEGGDQK